MTGIVGIIFYKEKSVTGCKHSVKDITEDHPRADSKKALVSASITVRNYNITVIIYK